MGFGNWRSAIKAFRTSWHQGEVPAAADLDIETVRARETELTRRAQSLSPEEVQGHVDQLSNAQASREHRWDSYLLLLTRHRRYKDVSKAMELSRQYREALDPGSADAMRRFLALHIYSIVLKETEDPVHIDESVRLARQSLQLLPDYPGALHNLAGGLLRQACLAPQADSLRQAALEEAQARVEQALTQEPHYPKYHATRARILTMQGRHDEAERDIRAAIDTEDSQDPDYAIRLSDYLDIKSGIALARTTAHMKDEIATASRDVLVEARRANIEILTIFIAVISFLIGGLTLAVTFAFDEAARLIFLLAAAMLLTLTGFSILYEGAVNGRRLVVALKMAVVLLMLAHVVPITLARG